MTTFSFGLLLGVLVWSTVLCQGSTTQSCQPAAAEESKRHKVYSDVDTDPGTPLVWSVNDRIVYDSTQNPSLLFDGFTVDPAQPWRWIQINRTERSYSGTYALMSRVNNTSQIPLITCQLEVYKKPDPPIRCTSVTVHNDNTFTTSCTTAKVFPQALCKLYVNSVWTDITSGYAHQELPGDPLYYSSTCDIKYDVTGMAERTPTVTVAMFPNATGLDETLGDSRITLSLRLSLPRMSLIQCLQDTSSVNDGYLLNGTTTTCTCGLAHPGVPQGSVHWSSPDGGGFTSLSQTYDEARIQINGAGTFTCEGISALKGPYRSETKTLKTAYGPNSTQIQHNASDPIDLCHSTNVSVSVDCSVDKSDVQPEPTFELSFLPQDTFTSVPDYFTTSPTSDKYTHTFILETLVGGSHTLTCVARNSKFGHVSARSPGTVILIRAPPSDPPKLVVRGSRTDSLLVEKDNVTVACTVTGGTPHVEIVTLTCEGREAVTFSGTSVTLTWPNISLSDNGTRCVCGASHVTQCYGLTTDAILNVVEIGSSRLDPLNNDGSSSSGLIIGIAVTLSIVVIIV